MTLCNIGDILVELQKLTKREKDDFMKVKSLFLSLILVFSLAIPVTANQPEPELIPGGPTISGYNQKALISQEIIEIEGIPVLFSVFNVDGLILETTTILENTENNVITPLFDEIQPLPDQFMYSLTDVLNQRLYEATGVRLPNYNTPNEPDSFLFDNYDGYENFESFGYIELDPLLIGTQRGHHHRQTDGGIDNRLVRVEHWFDYNVFADLINATVSLTSGGIRASSPSRNAESLSMWDTITRGGTALNFSFPWAVSFSGTSTQQIWRSPTVHNANTVTWRWDRNISGAWIFTATIVRDLVSIETRADATFRVGNNVFGESARAHSIINTW